MIFTSTSFEGLTIIEPRVFEDERGYFYESFNQSAIDIHFGGPIPFMQDNQSCSKKNVLRGLHFQNPPFPQIKLVRVIQGAVMDVVVDIRKSSKTFGKHFKIVLSAENKKMLWIPEGFAHGFITLENDSVFLYKCSSLYSKVSEQCIKWNDKDLNIDWESNDPLVSAKDQQGVAFSTLQSAF